ncbi:unnamed protein product, partial [Iphiclides podalirius]
MGKLRTRKGRVTRYSQCLAPAIRRYGVEYGAGSTKQIGVGRRTNAGVKFYNLVKIHALTASGTGTEWPLLRR